MLTLMIAPPDERLSRVLRVVHAGVAAAELRCVCGQWLVCDSDAGRDADGEAALPAPAEEDVVRAVTYSGYTVKYCATCQTGGKVLADNTTSKFLR
jgi:formamidopyrimidine-DNA glycosylase